MAFTSTVTMRTVFGNKRFHAGTYTNTSATTGGDIDTGLRKVESFDLTQKSNAVVASQASVNESLPCDGSAVTIVTAGGGDGYWQAWGY